MFKRFERPVWLGQHEIINREALFGSFRGLLTYGSPLERFGVLWASTVPINLAEDVFAEGTEWINVYDPTDPVATWIANFDGRPAVPPRPGHTVLTPQNYPCRASPVVLLSHICYLTASRGRALRLPNDAQHFLVNQVAHWLVLGGSLGARVSVSPKGKFTFWMPFDAAAGRVGEGIEEKMRLLWRMVQWIIVAIALTLLTLASIHLIIFPSLSWLLAKLNLHIEETTSLLTEAICLWGAAILVVLVASVAYHFFAANRLQEFKARIKEQSSTPGR